MFLIKGWQALTPDARILFLTRILRMFAYGLISVVLVLYLSELGLSTKKIGVLLTLTLLGDTLVSLWMTTSADRLGRRKMLLTGAALMIFAGVTFALTHNFIVLLVAAIIGVISPSGNEVGPFLSIEQAALSHIIPGRKRLQIFAWYNLVGSFAVALGALTGGILAQRLHAVGFTMLAGYRATVVGYAFMGLLLALLFLSLSDSVEIKNSADDHQLSTRTFLGLHRSHKIILKLSALFALDAFAGGFVMQSLLAYWFHVKFGLAAGFLGAILFGANILAGISALSAAKLASRIGLINTMVFTHLPSNILLILVPLMPNVQLAVAVLFLRFAISQMDVPARQAYTISVVHPNERSAAGGITGIARTIGVGLSPIIAAPLIASTSLLSLPFFVAGGLKILYDLLLYRSFKTVTPPDEHSSSPK
ncbi:MFS transporter [Pedosphaera parvula]|uniref:Major facilitator superfamily MFS_1 n=1 Tax=Pedosphaera parvula (strain Ellin514) TaxID=320771 RepID=B9XRL4_PEDPL|nr:MFS transporter [Pedosphaera parvula]EEF57533.1 major facilitator superfamily MFS_1 [Pedosphaera parvula Ellin514]